MYQSRPIPGVLLVGLIRGLGHRPIARGANGRTLGVLDTAEDRRPIEGVTEAMSSDSQS